MATPGELVSAMAAALGLSEATIFQFDRQLAEAGLRSKSGRGRSAARVTPEDAANLLISVAASPLAGFSAKDAAKTCRTYRALPHLPDISRRLGGSKPFVRFGLPAVAGLPDDHTFGMALAALIAAAAAGEQPGFPDAGEFVPSDELLRINFMGPEEKAEILTDVPSGLTERRGRMVYHPGPKPIQGDLRQERSVTFITFKSLGKLFS